jgi:hypothetical protein
MNTINEGAPQLRTGAQPAPAIAAAPGENIPKAGEADENDGFKIFGDDGFTFLDFLDVINPLQHIPVIGTMYREMTGDTMDPGSRVIGGTLFLGPFGTVSALANVMVDDATGKDMGEHVLAFFDDPQPNQPEVSGTGNGPVAMTAAPESIDPVTAWALAEISYRQSAAPRPSTRNSTPNTQQAAVSMTETASIAEWARAEVSYRKAAAKAVPARAPRIEQRAEQAAVQAPAPTVSQVSAPPPSRNLDALAALRKDLLGGAQRATARTAYAAADARQTTTSLAATRQPAPAGAVASKGGWFSETMLSALVKRDGGGKPADAAMTGAVRPVVAGPAR